MTSRSTVPAAAHAAVLPGFGPEQTSWDALQIAVKIAVLAASLAVSLHILLAQTTLLRPPSAIDLLDSAMIATMIASALCYGVVQALRREISQVTEARDAFAHLSMIDTLSGLPNRRAFEDTLASRPPMASLALIDIDHFKRINDTHGHLVGDQVIRGLADRLGLVLEAPHFVARTGGEEFAAIVRGKATGVRLNVLHALHRAISQTPLSTSAGLLDVTVSIGVAEIEAQRSRESLLVAADKALYAAKHAGRNRVMHEADMPDSEPVALSPAQRERRLYRAS